MQQVTMQELEAWSKTGFTLAEARGGMFKRFAVSEADDWRAEGFSPATAADWRAEHFKPAEAHQWHNHGFYAYPHPVSGYDEGFSPSDARKWIDNGFTLADAIDLINRDISAEEARQLRDTPDPEE